MKQNGATQSKSRIIFMWCYLGLVNPLLRKSGGQSLTKNDPSCVTLPNLSFNLKKASRPGLGLIWHPSQELTLLIHQKTAKPFDVLVPFYLGHLTLLQYWAHKNLKLNVLKECTGSLGWCLSITPIREFYHSLLDEDSVSSILSPKKFWHIIHL